ncbi:hypothetical protein BT93_K1324 [Corymbia citriodora subsp. variegata]|nr:hypothetical protein BT93_K1324 [Corymbia citriodora subsp. variegata]
MPCLEVEDGRSVCCLNLGCFVNVNVETHGRGIYKGLKAGLMLVRWCANCQRSIEVLAFWILSLTFFFFLVATSRTCEFRHPEKWFSTRVHESSLCSGCSGWD